MKRGLTLVEMLVSLACVILLMLAYAQLFAEAGFRINDARGNMEMINRLRSAASRLRADLAGVTVEAMTWQRPESGAGYLEIIEGPQTDTRVDDTATVTVDESTYPVGDGDDGLMMTVRSKGAPFTGLYNGTQLQSEVAEVIWFLRPTLQPDPNNPPNGTMLTNPPTYTLYRRVRLVLPNQPSVLASNVNTERFDWSYRLEGTSPTVMAVGNTLADLTKRENRFAHDHTRFPHVIDYSQFVGFPLGHSRYGQDVVLTNVLAFDVQVWDATAPNYISGGVTVSPGDPGFTQTPSGTPPRYPQAASLGAYVDLNWARRVVDGVYFPDASTPATLGPFHSPGATRSQLVANFAAATPIPATYDTWSFHYEHDGINQADHVGAGLVDEGTDGFDNDNANGVDDPAERETSPPYPVPLRGIKIRIRCYEPDTRQIREVSIVHSFVPE